ncbi:hypothetical protein ACIBCM_27740 [Streptomyces sp. NPDC051018]|uniref:hypothetical protein n=1 Tax=Streptomyces sp. NPDC051018 TaxID=3365639 RepID=UPI0037ADEA26
MPVWPALALRIAEVRLRQWFPRLMWYVTTPRAERLALLPELQRLESDPAFVAEFCAYLDGALVQRQMDDAFAELVRALEDHDGPWEPGTSG